jgi:hypothetical protein
MKMAFLAMLLSAASSTVHAAPGLAKLHGTYRSDEGRQFIVTVNGGKAILRTDAELSRYGLCKTPVVLVTANLDSDDDYAEARFDSAQGGCSHIDGPITLHYNRALTGVDVFLVDVVIRAGHGRDSGQSMRWHLTKIR